jgi:hypothetical protein
MTILHTHNFFSFSKRILYKFNKQRAHSILVGVIYRFRSFFIFQSRFKWLSFNLISATNQRWSFDFYLLTFIEIMFQSKILTFKWLMTLLGIILCLWNLIAVFFFEYSIESIVFVMACEDITMIKSQELFIFAGLEMT